MKNKHSEEQEFLNDIAPIQEVEKSEKLPYHSPMLTIHGKLEKVTEQYGLDDGEIVP